MTSRQSKSARDNRTRARKVQTGRYTRPGPKPQGPVGDEVRGDELPPGDVPPALRLARHGGLACSYTIDEAGEVIVAAEDSAVRTNWLTLEDPLTQEANEGGP